MKNYILFLLCVMWSFAFGQHQNEFDIHLKSLDTISYSNQTPPIKYTATEFRDFFFYTIKRLLSKPSDKQFISNRRILPKLKLITCDSMHVVISDTLITGELCKIELSQKRFNQNEHKFTLEKDGDFKRLDGLYPYGGQYGRPDYEIEKLTITINNKSVLIPRKAYINLYRPNICEDYGFDRKIEAYTSLDGQFVYLYIYGGNAAGSYFAKLIFNKEKFLTKIVADYFDISTHHSFSPNFIGF